MSPQSYGIFVVVVVVVFSITVLKGAVPTELLYGYTHYIHEYIHTYKQYIDVAIRQYICHHNTVEVFCPFMQSPPHKNCHIYNKLP